MLDKLPCYIEKTVDNGKLNDRMNSNFRMINKMQEFINT